MSQHLHSDSRASNPRLDSEAAGSVHVRDRTDGRAGAPWARMGVRTMIGRGGRAEGTAKSQGSTGRKGRRSAADQSPPFGWEPLQKYNPYRDTYRRHRKLFLGIPLAAMLVAVWFVAGRAEAVRVDDRPLVRQPAAADLVDHPGHRSDRRHPAARCTGTGRTQRAADDARLPDRGRQERTAPELSGTRTRTRVGGRPG